MSTFHYFAPAITFAAAATIAACSVSADNPIAALTPTAPDKRSTPDAAGPVHVDEGDDAGAMDAGRASAADAPPEAADANASATDAAACAPMIWYADKDGDGFGNPSDTLARCTAPSGYVAKGGDCDDTHATIAPDAVEVCNAKDDNCDGAVDGTPTEAAACVRLAGSYPGAYTLYTAEKLGSSVINEMTCTGTSALVVDLSAAVTVHGTVACVYGGGLGGFDHNQTGTLQASVRPDGTIAGTLEHVFDAVNGTRRSFPFTGHLTAAKIRITATGSWLPNPLSAVPWVVTFSVM